MDNRNEVQRTAQAKEVLGKLRLMVLTPPPGFLLAVEKSYYSIFNK